MTFEEFFAKKFPDTSALVPVMVAAFREIAEEAYNAGREDGYDDGYDAGYDVAYSIHGEGP
jgi:hypothetical protein